LLFFSKTLPVRGARYRISYCKELCWSA